MAGTGPAMTLVTVTQGQSDFELRAPPRGYGMDSYCATDGRRAGEPRGGAGEMSETLQVLKDEPERAPHNRWRRATPGEAGWAGSARPGAPNKYFMFSADTHVVEPAD